MSDYMGMEYLRRKLNQKRQRVNLRYKYYEMKNYVRDFGISTPPELRGFTSSLGWCAKAVDSLADRVVFNEFRNDLLGMNSVFRMNNPDVLFQSAELSAMIAGCAFIYIQPPQRKGDNPSMQVIDGANATGIIDTVTGLLKEGYAVLERDQYGMVKTEAYFLPNETQIYYKDKSYMDIIRHEVAYPLLVPVIYRPGAKRPFGHSRISRACMSLMSSAIRTMKRSEISAEFFSYPQKWVTGLSEDNEIADKWRASMATLIAITKDEDGDKPTFGQFMQQSMTPHTDHLKMFASMFAGETGLTLDDLGFPTANPSSADAIKAAHDSLRLTARAAQRSFGVGFRNAGFLAVQLRDQSLYMRDVACEAIPSWEPIFEPDASMLSAIGDGVLKLNQSVEGYIDEETLGDLTGIRKMGESNG
ncbi:MAG: phage portal protein [Clostridia bacterium]|nr:phage portal protein [Clostridia bacterium]